MQHGSFLNHDSLSYLSTLPENNANSSGKMFSVTHTINMLPMEIKPVYVYFSYTHPVFVNATSLRNS